MKLSLKWKMTLYMWFLAAICAIVAGSFSVWILIQSYTKSLDQRLQSTASTLLTLGITNFSGIEKFQQLDEFLNQSLADEKKNLVIRVYTRKGKMMFSSPDKDKTDFAAGFQPIDTPEVSEYESLQNNYRVLTTPYKAKSGKQYFLQLALTYPDYGSIISRTIWWAGLMYAGLAVLAFFISSLLARNIVSPVRSIALYINDLEPSETREWPPLILPKAGQYLQDIVNGINNLTRKVKASLYGVSRVSRYLAHEIRNPLTVLLGEAETILAKKNATNDEYREVLESSIEEIDRMENAVNTITRTFKKEKIAYKPVPLNITRWIDSNIEHWRKNFGRELQWNKSSTDLTAIFDPDLLFRLLDNLIRNTKTHTESNIRLSLTKKDEVTSISVDDNGPGMPQELLKELNSGTLSDSRVGIGLHLCIEIASICNFKLRFSNKPEGGLSVTIQV